MRLGQVLWMGLLLIVAAMVLALKWMFGRYPPSNRRAMRNL